MANLTIIYALVAFFFINIASCHVHDSLSVPVESNATDIASYIIADSTMTTTVFFTPDTAILKSVESVLSAMSEPPRITDSGPTIQTSTLTGVTDISPSASTLTGVPISPSATDSDALTTTATVSSAPGNVTSIVVETSTAPPNEVSTTAIYSNTTKEVPQLPTTVLTVTANKSSTVTVTTASASASKSPLPADAAAGLDMVPAVLLGGLVLAVFGA